MLSRGEVAQFTHMPVVRCPAVAVSSASVYAHTQGMCSAMQVSNCGHLPHWNLSSGFARAFALAFFGLAFALAGRLLAPPLAWGLVAFYSYLKEDL